MALSSPGRSGLRTRALKIGQIGCDRRLAAVITRRLTLPLAETRSEAGVTGAWSKALAMSTALLGLGYIVAGMLWSLNRIAPNAACLIMVGLGVSLAAVAAGVRRRNGRAKATATVAGFVGTLVFGALLLTFDRDPEVSEIANDVAAATAFGLAGLSALVLAMGVSLAVIETNAARNEHVNIG